MVRSSHFLLMCKWVSQPSDAGEGWGTVYQIVVPVTCRQHVLELAHEHLWSGHLADVVSFCKTCPTCQIVGKPNQVVPPAHLRLIFAVCELLDCDILSCINPLTRVMPCIQVLTLVFILMWGWTQMFVSADPCLGASLAFTSAKCEFDGIPFAFLGK